MSWQEVMRIAGTQIVVSTIAKRIDSNQVEVRQCTEPEKQLSDLYKKLDLTSPPLKRRRKICVVHFSELKNNKAESCLYPYTTIAINYSFIERIFNERKANGNQCLSGILICLEYGRLVLDAIRKRKARRSEQ